MKRAKDLAKSNLQMETTRKETMLEKFLSKKAAKNQEHRVK